MPPTSDGIRTVGCNLERLIPDAAHLDAIRNAVVSTHKATILATELLNMHARRLLIDAEADLSVLFNASWILNAYNEVTFGKGKVKVVKELRRTKEECMPPFSPPDRTGIQQCLLYGARNLAAVASTGVWMHFQKRVLSHVRTAHKIGEAEYSSLSKEEKRQRKLEIMQMAADICRTQGVKYQSSPNSHEWVNAERKRLGIDEAVGRWKKKPILYHLKAKPHCFLKCMMLMSRESEGAGGRAFALYPLRRSYVPKHARFDQKALRDLLGIGQSDYIKQQARKRRKRKASEYVDPQLPVLQQNGVGYEDTLMRSEDGKRRTKQEMEEENMELFSGIVDLRAAGVARRQRFDFAFTTDGVGARVQMRSTAEAGINVDLKSMPKRGIWAIDELKRVSRMDQMHVIGIDPGKRELVVGVDMDRPKEASAIRYTQKERLRDIRSRQYADEGKRGKPIAVKDAEAVLAGCNSRSADLATFCTYCDMRHQSMDVCLSFYSDIGHRRRRWKTAIKAQQSEEKLYKRLETVQKKGDARPIVLAYGSWGMVAGKAGSACNRGNPPCIGVGLMRKLARRFVVSPTPEAYTSKTCCRCFSPCGPWEEKEAEIGRKVRGLRRCTQRDCMLPLNRDRNGATNIGINFKHLMEGTSPVRCMSNEDLAFHHASICLECD